MQTIQTAHSLLQQKQWRAASPRAPAWGGVVRAILLLSLLFLSLFPRPQFEGSLPTLVPLVALTFFYFYRLNRKAAAVDRTTANWLFSLFLLRLAVSLVINQYYWWPQAAASPENDWDRYEALGWTLRNDLASIGTLQAFPFADIGPVYFVALVYKLAGRNPAGLAVCYSTLMAFTALGVYRLAHRLGFPLAARTAAILFSLLPLGLSLESMPAKDVLVCALLVMFANLLERLIASRRWRDVVGIALCAAAILLVRSALFYVVGALAAFRFLMAKAKTRSPFITIVALAFIGAIMLGILFFKEDIMMQEYERGPRNVMELYGGRFGRADFETTPESSLSTRLYWDGDWRKAYLIPPRSIMQPFLPFPPIKFSSWYETFESLNVWYLALLLPGILAAFLDKGVSVLVRIRDTVPCWLPAGLQVVALGAGLPFMQSRYVLPAHPFYCLLAAIGFTLGSRRRLALYYYLVLAIFGVLLVVYYTAKSIQF